MIRVCFKGFRNRNGRAGNGTTTEDEKERRIERFHCLGQEGI